RVAQLDKARSNEGDQKKPGPSGVAKKRTMAVREVNPDAQQAVIDNDSPSTSAGMSSKPTRASNSSKAIQSKIRKSPRVCQAEKGQPKRVKRPRDDRNKHSPGPSGIGKMRKVRL